MRRAADDGQPGPAAHQLVQRSGDQLPELIRRLLQYVVNATPPDTQLPGSTGGGVAALALPPNPAEVLEVLPIDLAHYRPRWVRVRLRL